MPVNQFFHGRLLVALLVAITIAACGGGSSAPAGVQPPPPKSISGVVMLGPVANADVEVSGTAGMLGSGTTRADGTFGPIDFSNSYTGPLRITVTGNAGSTWICDNFIVCAAGGAIFQAGDSIDFDGTLEAVLTTAVDGQFVSVSMLSNFAAARMDVLGALTSTNIDTAYADIAGTIRIVLGDAINDLSLVLPDVFASIELFDLQNLPAPGGADDALSVLLTFLNSGLMGLGTPQLTTGEFIDLISNDIAANPVLSVSDPDFFAASMESLLTMFLVQASSAGDPAGPLAALINALLAPADIDDVLLSTFTTFIAMPALDLGVFDLPILVDDVALQAPIFRELPVTTNTGELLQASEYGVDDVELGAPNWLTATAVMNGGLPFVRIDLNNAVIGSMANGTYEAFVEAFSTTGEFRRHSVRVIMTLQVP